jgi:ferric-dicitrate binding protein FerR (iron transport regulator)
MPAVGLCELVMRISICAAKQDARWSHVIAVRLRSLMPVGLPISALGSPVNVDPVAVMAWREGQLVFRQAPLAEVVNEVNRYRNGRIVLANEALGRRPVDVRIPIDRVDDLIAMVREAYGAKVTTLPGAIVIIS